MAGHAKAIVVGLAVLGSGLILSLWGPMSFLHPDEQAAVAQARSALGMEQPLPESLAPWGFAFVPFNVTVWSADGRPSTGFGATGGMGFAYPLLLAPFVALGTEAAFVTGPLALALLYLGAYLFLGPHRPHSWFLALLGVAVPSVILHATLLYSNLPGLALHVLALGLTAQAGRTGRPWMLGGAVLAAILAAGVRRDFLISTLALLVLAPVYFAASVRGPARVRGLRAWGAAVFLAIAAAALAAWAVTGAWTIPYAHGPLSQGTFDPAEVFRIVVDESNARQARSDPALLANTAERYLFTFVPFLVVGAGLVAVRPGFRDASATLIVPLAIHGGVVWGLTAGGDYHGLTCQCVDESHARYLFPLYEAAALGSAVLLAGVLDRVSTRPVHFAALLTVALVVAASTGHAYQGEHGVAWIHERREAQNLHDIHASQLPPEAVVAGDFLSKIVYSRPVLVPARVGESFPSAVESMREAGHPVFVNIWWAVKDETYNYGGLVLESGNQYFAWSGVGDYYEIRVVAAKVQGVFDLQEGEWREHPGQVALEPLGKATFRPAARPGVALPVQEFTEVPAFLNITYYEATPGEALTVGFGPEEDAAAGVLASWNTTGTGEWRTARIHVPSGLRVGGEFHLQGFRLVHALRVEWIGHP